MIKKEELLSEIVSTFASFNRAKAFLDFQFYLKGENFLLSYLYRIGGESTPGKLTQILDVSAARVAAILRSLERKKLVERITDKDDKRRVTVKITEKGIEWVTIAGSEVYQHALNVFDKLGEEDTKELVRILKKMMRIENGEDAFNPLLEESKDDIAEVEQKFVRKSFGEGTTDSIFDNETRSEPYEIRTENELK